MPTYQAPVADVKFLLNDVFQVERYSNLPGFADASPDMVEAVLGDHPAVSACVVIALPVTQTVSRLKAIVVPRPNAKEGATPQLSRSTKSRPATPPSWPMSLKRDAAPSSDSIA